MMRGFALGWGRLFSPWQVNLASFQTGTGGFASLEGPGTRYLYTVRHSRCTHVCAALQLAAFLDGEGALRNRGAEQGNFTLAFDLHHRRGGSSLYPALQGAQGHQGEHARPARDYTETQGCCLLMLSPPSCTFPFSISSPLPASHGGTAPSLPSVGKLPGG